MLSSVRNIVPVLLFVACTPQNASLTGGSYVAFFSEGSSVSLASAAIDPSDDRFATTYTYDCREFDDQEEGGTRLEDSVGCSNNIDNTCVNPGRELGACENWSQQAGFRVVGEDLEPWRGEATISSEGDLQIGFHHRMPGGADFRFIFAVDPNFQPTTCLPGEEGGVQREPLDGDWIAEWSAELRDVAGRSENYQQSFAHMAPYLDDGRLFFLNARGYQVNPGDGQDFWFLPDQFEAGAAIGKISEELLQIRPSVWAYPYVYNAVQAAGADEGDLVFNANDLWHCTLDPEDDPNADVCMNNLTDTVTETQRKTFEELRSLFSPDNAEPVFNYRPMMHMNKWRQGDGVRAGFDGWGEMHYNYVVFSADSVLEPGGSAEGAFSLVLEAEESWTTVFIQGTFEIDRIKSDFWTTKDLRAEKAEQNGVELCFQQ